MKFFKIIYYLALAFILLVAVLLIVSIFPIAWNFRVLTVLSGSMEPSIKTGSVVVVKPAADYKIGDVITFGPVSKTKPPVTHRISDIKVQAGQPVYITKGDANNAVDSKEIAKSEVLGKVLFDVPYIGYVIDFVRKPFGFMLIIVVPAIVIIYDEIRKVWAEVGRLKNKKHEEKEE